MTITRDEVIELRRVVSTTCMDDETFAYHLALRHPAMRGVCAPEPTREGHAIAHRDYEHAHYHDRSRRRK
jgi:hypothetical protein